jgi:molybdopterin molybdotransferase
MKALHNDCFTPGSTSDGGSMRLDDALRLLDHELQAVAETERVPLRQATRRILAEDIVAARDVPLSDNSAVDGYAVCFDDLKRDGETALPIAGRIVAGHALGQSAKRGAAYRIFTGAALPQEEVGAGPDTVAMQEDCVVAGSLVKFPAGLVRGANVRRRGEDIAEGSRVLARGRRLLPPEIGVAASLGLASLAVYRKLRVALFSTGDELREPGQSAGGALFDSNRFGIAALLQTLPCDVTDLGILPDDREIIRAAIGKAARDHDLLLTSGGVSMGEEDHVRAAVESQGAIDFWKLAIKPGHPIAFGRVHAKGHNAAFLGLPGNPVAVMVTFLRIVRPAILRLAGASPTAPLIFRVPADFAFKKTRERVEWIRAQLAPDAGGRLVARKHPKDGSGVLTAIAESDGLVELVESVREVKPGDLVDFLPFSEVMG